MIVAITGVTGNMGQATLTELVKLDEIEKFKLLVLPDDKKRWNKLKHKLKKHKQKFEVIFGNLKNFEDCEKLVSGVNYVVGMAAVIPPKADQFPKKAIECNQIGIGNLVTAIENIKDNQPKFIHISTLALYGNRNHLHPWARVGDPLLVSPYDVYSASKMRGEFKVLESNIKNYAVIRQTAMLHSNMLSDNMHDGLMFHTCFNAPLEWATAHDSGVLIANILKRDFSQDLSKMFWKKCFNLGGGIENCVTGYDTLNDGFEIIGGNVKQFFEPNFNATRNFHGVWFYDSKVLDNMFYYQMQTTKDFWAEFADNHKIFKAGKLAPKGLIKTFAIKRLFKSPNAAKYWVKHNDEARVFAYFGGKEKYNAIPKNWKDFGLLNENKTIDGKPIDYNELKRNKTTINHYFNLDAKTISIEDLKAVALAHGGKLISKTFNGLYEKLEWENSDGERFWAKPYTVMYAGHWYNITYRENAWDFDRLSKKDKIYAQLWYDSHDENENKFYYMDENFNARIKEI